MKLWLALFIFFLFLLTIEVVSATVGPGIPENPFPGYEPEWELCESDHLDNTTPECFEWDVEITGKGVQTCVDVLLDQGCSVNLSFYWYNWTYAIENYGEEVAIRFEIPDAWELFYYAENINASGKYCVWDENVSCATENWWTEMHVVQLHARFNCSGSFFNESLLLPYFPEYCPVINYIYPPFNETQCPCCINLCVGVNDSDGNLMNVTFYSNLSGEWDYFYLGTINRTLTYVPNGTYCIQVPYYSLYNHTYYWYVNITDTVTNESIVSDMFFFRTVDEPADCYVIDDIDDIIALIEEYDNIKDDTWIVGVVLLFSIFGIVAYRRTNK